MAPQLKPPQDEPEVMLDINTTPLIDVMLVLLIMLIVTIPIQWHSVNLDMPQAAPASPTLPKVIEVQIDARNAWRWNGQAVSDRADLQQRMREAAAQEPQPELHIRADGRATYDAVAAVMASAQRENLHKIGIVGTAQFAP